jgi:hypothetical protein
LRIKKHHRMSDYDVSTSYMRHGKYRAINRLTRCQIT